MIKVKAFYLLDVNNVSSLHPKLIDFFNFIPKNGGLRYDKSIFEKAANETLNNLIAERINIVEDNSLEITYKVYKEGSEEPEEKKTKRKIDKIIFDKKENKIVAKYFNDEILLCEYSPKEYILIPKIDEHKNVIPYLLDITNKDLEIKKQESNEYNIDPNKINDMMKSINDLLDN